MRLAEEKMALRANAEPTHAAIDTRLMSLPKQDSPFQQWEREQAGPEGQLCSLSPEEQVLQAFNSKYAVVRAGSTHILIRKNQWEFELESRSSFLAFHENDGFLTSQSRPMNKALFWLRHPQRRTFEGMIFDPRHPGDQNGHYNIFRGFAVRPRPGNCLLFWSHVREVICSGQEPLYQYVRKWMAAVVQQPQLLATALVLRGLQGTGKNRFVDHFGSLFGPYFLTVNNLDHLIGRFNAQLRYAFLIHANEAIWSGSRKEAGALKALITDPHIILEGKGRDALTIPNCRHLIVSSNESCPVPLDLDDRRFFVLNVSSHRKEDLLYFSRLEEQMLQGGREALLFDLYHEDLNGFDPRRMPVNDMALDLKLESAAVPQLYLFEALREGRFNLSERHGEWDSLPCEFLYRHYRDWCEQEGIRPGSSSELGRELHRILQVGKTRRSCAGIRAWWYELEPLERCRARFELFCKQSPQIWNSEV